MRQYRPEIDGLRAVAVLPVVLFHAGLPGIGGGFVGVDVFFVISGYLIAAILLEERARGTFSFAAFYARRARRILPLLAVVCGLSVPVALALMLPADLKEFGASLAGAATFTVNLMAANNVGYFDRSAEVQPLLHIWSLAVEEQFYLLFPLLLPVILRMGGLVVVLGLAVLGVGLAEVWLRHDAAAAFYLPHTRGWTILIGVACAMWERGRPGPVAGHGGLAALGLGMIAAAVAGLSPGVGYPGVWTLVPVGGAALVLLFARPGTGVARLLSWRPMVGIGLISYGLYLWHQPVLAFARYGREAALPVGVVVLCLALILALSVASWAFVERPFRRARAAPGRVLGVAGVVSAALIAVGAVIVLRDGLPGRFGPEVLAILAAEEDRNPLRRTCSSNGARIVPPEEACILGDRAAVIGALVGDSHADTLVVPLSARLEAAGLGMELLTYSGCPVSPGIRQRGAKDNRCDLYTDMVFDHLAARPEVKVIILHARWSFYLQGDGYDNGEGGVEELPPGPFESRDLPPGSEDEAARKAAVLAAYVAGVQRMLDMGRTVILITPVPEVGWHVPRHMAFATLRDGVPPQVSTDAARFRARNAEVLAAFAALAGNPRLTIIRPDMILCDTDLPGRCVASRDGVPLYADGDHLTNRGADLLVEALLPYLPGP